MIDEEEWRTIPDSPGYEVSNHGRVRSVDRVVFHSNGKIQPRKGRILKPNKDKDGYLRVGVNGTTNVHRLVMLAFVGERPDGMEVLHGDDVKDNNHLSNLRYGTHKENIEDKMRKGNQARGERIGASKLTESSIPTIKWMYEISSLTHRQIGELLNINHSTIGCLLRGETWKHLN